jgi:hypothetical protein
MIESYRSIKPSISAAFQNCSLEVISILASESEEGRVEAHRALKAGGNVEGRIENRFV